MNLYLKKKREKTCIFVQFAFIPKKLKILFEKRTEINSVCYEFLTFFVGFDPKKFHFLNSFFS